MLKKTLALFSLLLFFFLGKANADENFLIYDEPSSTFIKAKENQTPSAPLIQKTWENFKRIMLEKIGSGKGVEDVRANFLKDCDYVRAKEKFLSQKAFDLLSSWDQKKAPLDHITPPNQGEWSPSNLTDEVKIQLIQEAQKARTHFYAPYSHFPVGAVLLTKKGDLIAGCNFENAAYGSTICAERGAMMHAAVKLNYGINLELQKEIVAVGLMLRGGGSPCGACRQVLNEANPKMVVVMGDIDGSMKPAIGLDQLLPDSFGPESLR